MTKLNNPSKSRFVVCSGLSVAYSLALDQVRNGKQEGWSPLWPIDRRFEHAPVPGLWAVKPYLGFHSVGAKFEELFIIAGDGAYWFDNDLPHMCRWQ